MTTEPDGLAADDVEPSPTREIAEQAQRALKESLAVAERGLIDAARVAERVIKESVDVIRSQAKACSGPASETVDDAQRYLVERIKERPVTATFAGLGIGLILGLMMSSRGK
jgi:ElaB/YqjD/DUF883 family membrane-anchored ribosome-binding protein